MRKLSGGRQAGRECRCLYPEDCRMVISTTMAFQSNHWKHNGLHYEIFPAFCLVNCQACAVPDPLAGPSTWTATLPKFLMDTVQSRSQARWWHGRQFWWRGCQVTRRLVASVNNIGWVSQSGNSEGSKYGSGSSGRVIERVPHDEFAHCAKAAVLQHYQLCGEWGEAVLQAQGQLCSSGAFSATPSSLLGCAGWFRAAGARSCKWIFQTGSELLPSFSSPRQFLSFSGRQLGKNDSPRVNDYQHTNREVVMISGAFNFLS